MLISQILVTVVAISSVPTSSLGWFFAEGYSSMTTGSYAELAPRMFTIDSGTEACATKGKPTSVTVEPKSIRLSVGDKIYRDTRSKLVIIAYDAGGKVLAGVPISVDVIADGDVLKVRSDWDYFIAVGPGRGKLIVSWRCMSETPISDSVPVRVDPA